MIDKDTGVGRDDICIIAFQRRKVKVGDVAVIGNTIQVLMQKGRSRLRRQEVKLDIQRRGILLETMADQIERCRLVGLLFLGIAGNKRNGDRHFEFLGGVQNRIEEIEVEAFFRNCLHLCRSGSMP